ncbi:MAG: beta-galactosidase, partial [Treponema sp.]|nr:beta-galactosidase [Treponema sp.]
EKLAACGFNTVETYVPWNLHEPKEGVFSFDGFGDLEGFIETAAAVGLKVIVRPGPYICAEWEFGGFPGWLAKDRSMRLRCMWPDYLQKVRNWFSALIPKLVPYLCTNGGPIIAVQIENEYGSYGSDGEYLSYLKNLLRELGVDSVLFTSDGPNIQMLDGGTLPDIWKTVNFGSNPERAFDLLRRFQPDGPDMCCEFWCGWFDHWGEAHHRREAADVADVLERIVKTGASVNMYMFHGGTNFGFWNGANIDDAGQYQPTTTSYDYHAPLSEAGDITPAYEACKKALEKYFGPAPAIKMANSAKAAYGKVELTQRRPLWDFLGEPVKAAAPLSMEELDQEQGFVLYRKRVEMPPVSRECMAQRDYKMALSITGFRDRAVVCVDGETVGVIYRNSNEAVILPMPTGESFRLDILVENMGRLNYGHGGATPCGIFGSVKIGPTALFGWEMYGLPLSPLPSFAEPAKHEPSTQPHSVNAPAFYRGAFDAAETRDTFLDLAGFRKGVAFVNGFNLGRYWEAGPARTLYVPAPLLARGQNEICLFETDGCSGPATVELTDSPVWMK